MKVLGEPEENIKARLLGAAMDGLRREAGTWAERAHVATGEEQARSRRHIYYRLGHILAKCYLRPLPGLFQLPFLLVREYREYLRSPKETKRIQDIYLRLRGGYAGFAIEELRQIVQNGKESRSDRALAAFYLAVGLYEQGGYVEALLWAESGLDLAPIEDNQFFELRLLCLLRLRQYAGAYDILRGKKFLSDAELILFSTTERGRLSMGGGAQQEAEAKQLEILNSLFLRHGLEPLALRHAENVLGFANIHAPSARAGSVEGPGVSVIMPAFNAEKTIRYAIQSLREQTWKNLEILVVDDGSTDATAEIAADMAQEESRLRLLRLNKNSGCYAARNAALGQATGEYITTHDSDDWSHPRKIEIQARFMAESGVVANITHLARLKEDLVHDGRRRFIARNLSSLFFRKEAVSLIGPWQEARVGGDAEFLRRMKFFFGQSNVAELSPASPLSLGLSSANSLIHAPGLEFRTLKHFSGLRNIYAQANAWRLEDSSKSGLREHIADCSWIQPVANRPGSRDRQYDLVVLSDFSLPGGSMRSSVNYALAARRLGLSVGLYHWKKYEFNPRNKIHSFVFANCRAHGLDLLCSADAVSCGLALVGQTAILSCLPDEPPRIASRETVVLVNQYASTFSTGRKVQYDPLTARENVRAVFGREGKWIPISGWVKELMRKDRRYPEPWKDTWHPLLDTAAWQEEIAWRGVGGEEPVLGRHGRDADPKWLASPKSLRAAYGADARIRARFMGGADEAIQVLGYLPANWEILPFDAMPVRDFLRGLDFFIHFPHQDYIEEFGRVVMEGMLAGKPAILPPRFRSSFGEAALYCEPKEVIPLVMRLWRDEKLYRAQARKGRDFVLKNCDWDCFKGRLAALGCDL